jgi:hypothetical protein
VGGEGDCLIIGAVVTGIGTPVLGKLAQTMCGNDNKRHAEEARKATEPDLAVYVEAGNGSDPIKYRTHTEPDQLSPTFNEEFAVPTDAISDEPGLHLQVQDENGGKPVGDVYLRKSDVADALRRGTIEDLHDEAHGLVSMGLTIRKYDGLGETVTADVDTTVGMGPVAFRASNPRGVRAGEVLELSASGKYTVGRTGFIVSDCPEAIGPEGVTSGKCKEYNVKHAEFTNANHGAGIALIGSFNPRQGVVVARCTHLVSRIAGGVRVGINDEDVSNNDGTIHFEVTVRPPSKAEWVTGTARPCAQLAAEHVDGAGGGYVWDSETGTWKKR